MNVNDALTWLPFVPVPVTVIVACLSDVTVEPLVYCIYTLLWPLWFTSDTLHQGLELDTLNVDV